MSSAPVTRWTWSREAAILGMIATLFAGLFAGYLWGQRAPAPGGRGAPAAPRAVTRTPAVSAPTGSGGPAAPTGFTVGAPAPWTAPLVTVAGRPGHLVRGARATVVVEMATWCLYCGYTDKYVVPVWLQTPGVAVNVVDLSPQGGIADPGPATPPFSGHDGTGGPETVAQMETTLAQYAQTYGTLGGAHLFVAPPATQTAWNLSAFPTIVMIDRQGRVVSVTPGAYTIAQARQALQAALTS